MVDVAFSLIRLDSLLSPHKDLVLLDISEVILGLGHIGEHNIFCLRENGQSGEQCPVDAFTIFIRSIHVLE